MKNLPRQTLLNVTSNVVGNIAAILSGILTVPHLVSEFGVATYGLWSLVAVLATLLSMFDLGVAGAVARLIAMNRNRDRGTPVDVIMSSAFVILLCVAIIVSVLTVVSPPLFFWLFDVPVRQMDDVSRALLLTGLNVAITLPGFVFSGYLWGHERFDLLNAIEIPVIALRTAAILTLVHAGTTLAQLATILVAFNSLGVLLRMIMSWWLDSNLRLRLNLFRFDVVKEIYGFGIWFFLLSTSRTLLPQIGPTIIGNRLGGSPVTTFAVGRQVSAYLNSFAIDATQVFAPRAAANYASAETSKQLTLFLHGGRFALALSLFLAGGAFCLGLPFIRVWQRGQLDDAYMPLLILTAGEVLPMSQWLTYSTILAMSRHRLLAFLALLEGVAILVLAVALVGHFGVAGVCLAIAVPGCILRGVCQWLYGCRLLKISPWRYVTQVFLPVTLVAAIPILAFATFTARFTPASWLALVGAGTLYLVLYASFLAPLLFGHVNLLRQYRAQFALPSKQEGQTHAGRFER